MVPELWPSIYSHWYSPSYLGHLKRENDDHFRERINLRTRITKRREGHQILVHEIHRLTLFLFGKKRATIGQSSYFNHPIFGEYQWSQPRKSHGCLVIKWIAASDIWSNVGPHPFQPEVTVWNEIYERVPGNWKKKSSSFVPVRIR